MLHLAVDAAFDDLLTCWRDHHRRQSMNSVKIHELAASRRALDHARHRMHKLRTAIYPEDHELESIVESIWCETLETVVHLRWADRHQTRPGNFTCVCGHLVPVDWQAAAPID